MNKDNSHGKSGTPPMREASLFLPHSFQLQLHTAAAEDLIVIMSHDLNGTVPTEIQLLPFGRQNTPKYGPIIVDDDSVAAIMAAHAARKNDDVIDYEHQTWQDPPVVAPAAGWIKQLINKGKEGIWGAVEWTEKARRMIEAKEYRYFSPVTLTRKDGKVLGLMGGGLTNLPNIDGMVPLTNKGGARQAAPSEEKPAKEEATMWKELLKLLGLAESATEAEAIVAVNKLKTDIAAGLAIVANKAVLTALELPEGAKESEVIATVMANRQAGKAIADLTAQVNKLTDELRKKGEEDVVVMVNKAIEDGKVTPAQRDWALEYAKKDPEGFVIFVNKAPVLISKQQQAAQEITGDGPAMDAAQVQINKIMGLDAETYKKFGPKKEEK